MRLVLVPMLAVVLASCSSQSVNLSRLTSGERVSGPRHVVGEPYFANGHLVRPRHQPNYNAFGKAAWYGRSHDGRLTANGEIVDSENLFAAHPTLPLPSYVSVRNLENDRRITVRVNDRAPVPDGAIISLSARAAELLDLTNGQNGTVHVRYLSPAPIEYIGRNN